MARVQQKVLKLGKFEKKIGNGSVNKIIVEMKRKSKKSKKSDKTWLIQGKLCKHKLVDIKKIITKAIRPDTAKCSAWFACLRLLHVCVFVYCLCFFIAVDSLLFVVNFRYYLTRDLHLWSHQCWSDGNFLAITWRWVYSSSVKNFRTSFM